MQIISPNGYRTIERTLQKRVCDADELGEDLPDCVTNLRLQFFKLLEKYNLPKPNIVCSTVNQCDCNEIESHFSKNNKLLYILKNIFQPEPNEESRILPHEYGHWLMNSFELYEREGFYLAFGDYNLPVNEEDGIKFDGDHVFLKAFEGITGPERDRYTNNVATLYEYMGKPIHPEESFAETLSVVLRFGPEIMQLYADNKIILKKIDYVVETIKGLSGKNPAVSGIKADDNHTCNLDSIYEHLMQRRKLFFEPIDVKLFEANADPTFLKEVHPVKQKVLEMKLI